MPEPLQMRKEPLPALLVERLEKAGARGSYRI
jgi:hypothetical protein